MGPDGILIAVAALLGATLGSFLNVCVHRLPLRQSIVHPPSHCPACGARIAWFDNVPIVSWLVLRGRCRRCRSPISVRYPLVEAGTALIWALSCWHYGATLNGLAAALFGTVLLGIVLTDAAHYIIPDEFTLGGLAIGGSFLAGPRIGVVTWLAAAAHEIPQELGDFAILVRGGWPARRALVYNFASALTIVPGGLLAFLAGTAIDTTFLLPLAAGNFLYIAASDLIPEIKHGDRGGQRILHLAAFVAGILAILAARMIFE